MRQTLRLILLCALIISAHTQPGWAEDPKQGVEPKGVFVPEDPKQGVEPKEGFVPTADVARAIAEAVLVPVYGKETMLAERPFQAALKKDVWIVTGSVPCENPPAGATCPGGAAEVRISRKTGRILYMTHSQ